MNILICVLVMPGILLVMDEGIYFPISNLVGLLMVSLGGLLVRHRERRRRYGR